MAEHPLNAATPPHRRATTLATVGAVIAAVAAIAGVAAIWTGVALMTGSTAGWMAIVAALDAALLLRLASYPPGRDRALFAVYVTVATAVLAGFLLATARIGLPMGLHPYHAAGRMSLELAWLWLSSNSGLVELGWLFAGTVVAWKAGR